MRIPAPMLCSPGIGDPEQLQSDPALAWEQKFDGVRVIFAYDGERHRLVTRGGRDISGLFPEIQLHRAGNAPMVLDGELMMRGQLNGTLTLRHLLSRVNRSAGGEKREEWQGVLVAFDCLVADGQNVTSLPYLQRRALLSTQLPAFINPLSAQMSPSAAYVTIRNHVNLIGGEGVVAKRINSRYVEGRRVSWWQKFKDTVVVNVIVYAYDHGKDHGLELAMVNSSGRVVPVGRVGSGLPISHLRRIREAVDTGNFPVVRVRAMGRTASGLREPVLVSVLAEADYDAASLDQLDQLRLT